MTNLSVFNAFKHSFTRLVITVTAHYILNSVCIVCTSALLLLDFRKKKHYECFVGARAYRSLNISLFTFHLKFYFLLLVTGFNVVGVSLLIFENGLE